MNRNSKTAKWGIVALIVFAAAMFRLVPYLFESMATYNFSPIAAMALFGGAYFSRKYLAFAFPLIALWASNLLLNNVFLAEYYEGFSLFANWEVYVAILLIVGLGILLLKKITVPRLMIASLSASVLFFVVSNFLVWAQGAMYPMTFTGLVECYTLAVPFFWNTLASDLIFVSLLFGAFEFFKAWKPKAALQNA